MFVSNARSLHDAMFKRVLASPMSVFDTQSAGRIVNRFSKVDSFALFCASHQGRLQNTAFLFSAVRVSD